MNDEMDDNKIPMNWQPGQVIADLYQVEDATAGGMGVVYFVKHLKWDIRLAVKTPLPEIVSNESAMKRFIKEAETWVNLGLHPHIASCYYVRMMGGLPRIFIEYVDGGSLREQKIRELSKNLDYAIQICRGMQYVHEERVVHRDLKPANCLVTKDGTVKVTDFGIAKIGDEIKTTSDLKMPNTQGNSISLTGGLFGTPEYMSPEQFMDAKNIEKESDIYSFGVMLYEMVCGRKPFVMPEEMLPEAREAFFRNAHLRNEPMPPLNIWGDCGKKLNDLILKSLEKSPKRRFTSFGQVEEKLIRIYKELMETPYIRKKHASLELRADALNNKALSLLDLSHGKEAKKCWGKALSIDHNHLPSIFNKGYYLWGTGELNTSDFFRSIQQIESTNRKNTDYWYHLFELSCEARLIETIERCIKASAELGHKIKEFMPQYYFYPDKVLRGHTKKINVVAVTSDNRYVISGSSDAKIIIWDIINGYSLRILSGHTGPISALIITNNQKLIISGSSDNTLRIWEIDTGNCLNVLYGHAGKISTIAISNDDHFFVSGSLDNTIKIWNVKTGKNIRTLSCGYESDYEEYDWFLENIVITSDGKCVIFGTGSDYPTVECIDVNTGKCLIATAAHTSPIRSVAISIDEQYIISQGEVGESPSLWDFNTGQFIGLLEKYAYLEVVMALKSAERYEIAKKDFNGYTKFLILDKTFGTEINSFKDRVNSAGPIAITSDFKYSISLGENNALKLWNTTTGICLCELRCDKDLINTVCIIANDEYVISADKNSNLILWNMDKVKSESKFQYILAHPASFEDTEAKKEEEESFLNAALMLIDNKEYKTAYLLLKKLTINLLSSTDNRVLDIIYRCQEFSTAINGLHDFWCKNVIANHGGSIRSIAIFPDGKKFISASEGETLEIWDIATCSCLELLKKHTGEVDFIAISPDSKYILTGGRQDNLRIWNIAQHIHPRLFASYQGQVNSIVISPDGRYTISGSKDGTIRLLDIPSGFCQKVLRGHEGSINSLIITADSRYVISGGSDTTLRIWDIMNGDCLKVIKGFKDSIHIVGILKPRKHIISGDSDGTLRIWDFKTGECINVIECHTGPFSSFVVVPKSDFIIIADQENNLKLWNILTGVCAESFNGHNGKINSLAISTNGRYVISGSDDQTIRIWELVWNWEFPDKKRATKLRAII